MTFLRCPVSVSAPFPLQPWSLPFPPSLLPLHFLLLLVIFHFHRFLLAFSGRQFLALNHSAVHKFLILDVIRHRNDLRAGSLRFQLHSLFLISLGEQSF